MYRLKSGLLMAALSMGAVFLAPSHSMARQPSTVVSATISRDGNVTRESDPKWISRLEKNPYAPNLPGAWSIRTVDEVRYDTCTVTGHERRSEVIPGTIYSTLVDGWSVGSPYRILVTAHMYEPNLEQVAMGFNIICIKAN